MDHCTGNTPKVSNRSCNSPLSDLMLLEPAPEEWDKMDVGEWWLEMRKQGRFKYMEMLALEYFAIPATGAPSERVFSRAGRELLDERQK